VVLCTVVTRQRYVRRLPSAPFPLLALGTMTPDDEARMAELLRLIAQERDPRRVVMLAKELEQLLASEPEPPEEPRSS
jgi:hypothetical protein